MPSILLKYGFSFMMLMHCLPQRMLAQHEQLTLEQCYGLARQQYPLIKKQQLLQRNTQLSLENISTQFLPQISIYGQASYQSETISFPQALAGGSGGFLPAISKDQYRLQADIAQQIYDGGNSRIQHALARSANTVQDQNLEVSLYQINERVNQLFFGILFIDEQVKLLGIRQDNLQQVTEKIAAAYDNGTAYKSNVDELKAERTQLDMQRIELASSRTAFSEMLAIMTGRAMDTTVRLVMPVILVADDVIKRPELNLFTYRKQNISLREQQLRADYMPRLSAFAQAAYGRPTLNIIKNQFGPWVIGGIRMNWNFGSLYTLKNNRLLLLNERDGVDVEQETFLFNTRLTMRRQAEDIKKFNLLIEQDERAIALRSSVRAAAEAQLENGVITVHDYIAQLNAENMARQNKVVHTIQLLQANVERKTTTGK